MIEREPRADVQQLLHEGHGLGPREYRVLQPADHQPERPVRLNGALTPSVDRRAIVDDRDRAANKLIDHRIRHEAAGVTPNRAQ